MSSVLPSPLLQALAFAGRNGPLLLFTGVLLGFALPPAAAAARPLMDLAVFCFTLGAFLKVDLASFRREVAAMPLAANLAVLGWATLGVPLVMATILLAWQPPPELATALLLCAAAPPVGSAAAIAAMLGLSAPLALFASVVATLAAPLAIPALMAALGGQAVQLDSLAMTLRLAAIIGGACLTSWALRRFAGALVRDNPAAMTGIAVAALLVFALGAMHGMQAIFLASPREGILMLALAFAVNAGMQLLGTMVFWAGGMERSLTLGLVSGNRNIGLAWAAAGHDLPMGTQAFLAASVLPIYMMPALTAPMIGWLLRRGTLRVGRA